MNATLVVSSAVLGMVNQTETATSDAEALIQGAAMQQILLVVIEIIIKKRLVMMRMIKTGMAESEIETDTGRVTEIVMSVTAVMAKIGTGIVVNVTAKIGTRIVMIVFGKIAIKILMVIEIMEDPTTETRKKIGIVTGVMKEIATGTLTIKTEREAVAESGVGRGAILMAIMMKLYTRSLFL